MIEQEDEKEESSASVEEIGKCDSEISTASYVAEDHSEQVCEEIVHEKDPKNRDEAIREIDEVIEGIARAVFLQTVQNSNFDKLGNRSSNTLGIRVKDSLILKVQQTQKKAMPFGGIRASQLACQLRQISCDEDDKVPFLPSPRIESPARSSESESPSTRQKKSVSLAENVEIFNRLENELFIENEAGIAIGELMIDEGEKGADREEKICGFLSEKSLEASIAESLSLVSTVKDEPIAPTILPIDIGVEDVEKIVEETSRDFLTVGNYEKNNFSSIQEIEIGKEELDFQFVERRSSSSTSSRYWKKSGEMLPENATPFPNGEDEDCQYLNTVSDGDSSTGLVNVEEETPLKNFPSSEAGESNRSLASDISHMRVNSTCNGINGNSAPEYRETEPPFAVEDIIRIADDTDQGKLFAELLADIRCIAEDLDDRAESLIEKLKKGEIVGGFERRNEDVEDELTSEIAEGVQQPEKTEEDREMEETVCDGNQAEHESQKAFVRSVKSFENVDGEDSTVLALNLVTAMLDSTLLSFDNNSDDRIIEPDEKSKNDYDDESISSNSLDRLVFNSESLYGKYRQINAEKTFESTIERSEDVVEEESLSNKNAALPEDRDDRSVFKRMEKNFIAAIVEGESLVKFATVSPGQKDGQESRDFYGKEAAYGQEVQTEDGEVNDRDLDDNFGAEINEVDPESRSSNESLPRSKCGLQLREKSTSDEELNVEKVSVNGVLTLENETTQDSVISLEGKKHEERSEKAAGKSAGSCEVETEAGHAAVGSVGVEIRKQSGERKTGESAKKFANSLSRIFGSYSSRSRNSTEESSPHMEPKKRSKTVRMPLASSDGREIEMKNANARVEDNGEEIVAVESLDSINRTGNITSRVILAAEESEVTKKGWSMKEQKCSSGKSFATIRKLFSKRSKRGTDHRVQKQTSPLKRPEKGNEIRQTEDKKQRSKPEATKRARDDPNDRNNRSKVPFINNSASAADSVAANKVEGNYDQQVSRPESREDKRWRPLSGVRSTNSGSIDHLERVEMRSSDEKNPPGESSAESTTPSVEDGGKKRRMKGIGESESMFSRTMKRLFRKRGSAAESVSSKQDSCSILSRNLTCDIDVETVTNNESSNDCAKKCTFRDEEFAVFDTVVTDYTRILPTNRHEISGRIDNDRESHLKTDGESKSVISLLRSKTAKESLDPLTKVFHESSKRSATTTSEDDMIESSSAAQTSARNTFSAAFTAVNNPQGETRTLARDFEQSTPFGRGKSIVVMMATPVPPRGDVQPETSNTSEHQQDGSSSSPSAFYYLLGPTLDEALLDVRVVFQKLIDKITGRGK